MARRTSVIIFASYLFKEYEKWYKKLLVRIPKKEQRKLYFNRKHKTSRMKNRVLLHYRWSSWLIEVILYFLLKRFVAFFLLTIYCLSFPRDDHLEIPKNWKGNDCRKGKFPQTTSMWVQGRKINFSTSPGSIVHSTWFSFAMQMLLLYFIHLIEFQISFFLSFSLILFESFRSFIVWRRRRSC